MCIVFEEYHQSTWSPNTASVRVAPSAVLTIPSISRQVPTHFAETCQPVYREFGKRLMEMGYLSDDSKKSIPTIINEGWSQYVDSLSNQPLSGLHFAISVSKGDGNPNGEELGDGHLCIHFWCDLTEAPGFRVKDRLETMRQRNPRIAWLALSALQDASRYLPIMTPDWFMSLVEESQWMGEEDESVVIKEFMREGEDPDDIDVLTRDEVFKVLPRWANRACHAKYERVRRKITSSALNEEDSSLLAKLDSLQDLIQGLNTDHDFVGTHHDISRNAFASLLFFDNGNIGGLFVRILDDFYQNLSENGYDSYLIRIAFHPTDSRETEHALHVMRTIFRMAEYLEDILTIIGDPI